MAPFYGKYRGKVAGTLDPLNLARIQVSVPAVLGDGRASWAMPCAPFAGRKVGFLAIPPVGANVWVEFEGGDPDYPIWSGGFWGPGEAPMTPTNDGMVICALGGITLTLGGLKPGDGLSVEITTPVAAVPLSLTMNAQGITLKHGATVSLSLSDEGVELRNTEGASLKLELEALTLDVAPLKLSLSKASPALKLENGATSLALTADAAELKQGAAALKLGAAGAELAQGASKLTVGSQGVELKAGAAKASVAAASVELSNGAASVKLSPATVNINNGALEVM
jgi:hypothetical protein